MMIFKLGRCGTFINAKALMVNNLFDIQYVFVDFVIKLKKKKKKRQCSISLRAMPYNVRQLKMPEYCFQIIKDIS